MRIIHTGDLHLEAGLSTNYTKEQARERRREMLQTFEHMLQYAQEQGVSVILLAGDFFDTGKITKRTRKWIYELMRSCPDIDFLYLRGNHDRNTGFGDDGENVPNLKLFGTQWTKFSYKELDISGIELTEENLRNIYDTLLLQPDRLNLVALHGQEAQYAPKDDREIIVLDRLKHKYIDYLALGHVHEYRSGKLDNRGTYCYCGCLEGRGFDECGTKGFVLLDVSEGRISHEFVPFAKRELHEVQVDLTGCESTQDMLRRMMKRLADVRIPKSDLVRVVLNGYLDMEAEKDTDFLQHKLEDQYYLLKIKDKTRLAWNPEDYRYDKSLKGEFVRMLAASGLPEEEKERIILTGIRALAGEEIDL